MTDTDWKVHKFGGTSLADAGCFRQVAEVLRGEPGSRQAVVVSAMGGMTDALLELVKVSEQSAEAVQPGLAAIADRYRETVEALLGDGPARVTVMEAFKSELSDAADILQAISLVHSAADRSRDLVAGFGELWSTRLLAAYLEQDRVADPGKREVRWVDARELIVVEPGELGPAVVWEQSRKNCARLFPAGTGEIVIVTGFIATDSAGLQTTLGRNGSDFSASILGALLNASSITIWSDVGGIMSADPGRVPEAAVIAQLSYSEAMELAYFGARVIHPQTMAPAVDRGIPIYIRNTFDPGATGSRVSGSADPAEGIKGITTVDQVALVNLEGTGLIGVPGTADRLFGALRAANISVILISQASSEHSICFAIPASMAKQAEQVVRRAFAAELEQNQVQAIDVQEHCSIIAVVGDGMAGLTGVAARFFGTLGNAGINVRAIAQGSSERNISAVIARDDATRALRAAHAGFYLSTETVSVGLVGPGNVGATLLDQMAVQAAHLHQNFNLDFRVRGIATSSRMYLAERMIELGNWRETLNSDSEPLDWNRFVAHVNADHLPHAVMVDCTASDEVAARYVDWFAQGIHVVTPNKKAQSGTLEYYDQIQAARREHNVHFLYEPSVGAALPIVQTLRDLTETGDEVVSIEGILSGTLAYLFNVFDGTRSFSAIVREAHENGYTEPDPRDDLSGIDVARKLIILSRELGLRIELQDIEIENLVPAGLGDVSVDEFLDALAEQDASMLDRWKKSNKAGEVQRYVGRLDKSGAATVRLESLPADHAFAHINLTDNIVRFVSERYSDNPLVVQGPGAGPAVTAAGVFADLLRLARYLGAPR
jgi:aspartokinase/homoserine dehydrogenase 1